MSSTENTRPVGVRLHGNERVAAGGAEPGPVVAGTAVRRGPAREADAVDRGHGRDLERRLGHGRRAGRGWYEGVERRDVLVIPIERMVVAGPVDLDPGEIAAQRDVGPAPARTVRVQTGRARSARVQVACVQAARVQAARAQAARVQAARGWAAAPRGSLGGRISRVVYVR